MFATPQKMMLFKFWIIFASFYLTNGLQNSSQICESICECSMLVGTFTIDCEAQKVTGALANWPDYSKNSSKIIGIFSYNHIERLEPLPPSDVEIIVFYDHCNVSELASGLFENCKNIQFADLSYNLLKADDLHSDVFKGPYNKSVYEPIGLQHLNLAYNQIHTLEKNLFDHMPNLRWLSLEGNHFRVFDITTVTAFASLSNLQYLNLAHNKFILLPSELLQPLKTLHHLDLARNEMNFVPDGLKHVGKTLKTLIIDGNPFRELEEENFIGMEAIVELSAKNLKLLFEIKTNTFAPLKGLIKMDLSGMNGTKVADEAFGNITRIRELNMSRSNLERLPIHLVNWTELQTLDLRYNNFYCECYLLNITNQIPIDIMRDEDAAPYCYDYKRQKQYEIYGLTNELCFEGRSYMRSDSKTTFRDLRVLRVSIVVMCSLLTIAGILAFYLGYRKYLHDKTNRFYPFASSVIYNPLATNPNPL